MKRTIAGLARAVKEIRAEEGSHAADWAKDAQELGVPHHGGPDIAGVRALIASAYTDDLPSFFAVLAGTDFIAEELSAYLLAHEPYTGLFERRRWVWGEVHVAPHEDGPSHLEIDIDLALAYAADGTGRDDLEQMVKQTIMLFGEAARGLEVALA